MTSNTEVMKRFWAEYRAKQRELVAEFVKTKCTLDPEGVIEKYLFMFEFDRFMDEDKSRAILDNGHVASLSKREFQKAIREVTPIKDQNGKHSAKNWKGVRVNEPWNQKKRP